MLRFRTVCAGLALLIAASTISCSSRAPTVEAEPIVSARAVEAEVRGYRGRDLWPGFDPLEFPLAIFDGTDTFLFRHPSPPEEFVQLEDGAWRAPGRYPSVDANTAIELAGIPTATLTAGVLSKTASRAAGVAAHEAFHVFQSQRHPTWSANEADLFEYPVGDSGLWALQKQELESLDRAMESESPEQTACWAGHALELRYKRLALIDDRFAEYERNTELKEGLARYVERRATGDETASILTGFLPEEVRDRAYATGEALARILDVLDNGWRESFEKTDSESLDSLLQSATQNRSPTAQACELDEATRIRLTTEATREIAALTERLAELERAFDETKGLRLVLVATGEPLFPSGFDPLNVRVVRTGTVLHRRMLSLGNGQGSIELLDREGLSKAAGDHPLFSGVRELIVPGLAEDPVQVGRDGTIEILAPGLRGSFDDAVIERSDDEIRIVVGVSAR